MSTAQLIPVNAINILNPRSRNKIIFEAVTRNICGVGLKKPISVRRRSEPLGEKEYDLVCGQGRLEAYQALGYLEIPALIREVNPTQAFEMSVAENIARRHYSSLELLKEITMLRGSGLSAEIIAKKLGLDITYIHGITQLLEHGEDALVQEVERGRIPMSFAVRICRGSDHELQAALREAYTSGELRGAQLLAAKRLLMQRNRSTQGTTKKGLTGRTAIRAYKQFTMEYKALVKRARQADRQLLLIVGAIRVLLDDAPFVTLLRAEGLDSLPSFLLERIKKG